MGFAGPTPPAGHTTEPAADAPPKSKAYAGPSGGWGSMEGMARVLLKVRPDLGVAESLLHQNKAGGHMCASCAWGKPVHPHAFEFCENGAKATIWDLTRDRCSADFFAKHTVTELLTWPDYDLEIQGRLTEPLRYDISSDRYLPCSWEAAFADIGRELKAVEPQSVVFYTSGKASLETSYLFGLFARLYGHNNLPDSSNMCHETTSVALKKVLGTGVGTCVLEDFEQCDAIFYFGQNPGTNSPRFLHPLQEAVRRGCKIITFNPVREMGLLRFLNPQSPTEMLTGHATDLSHLYLQVRPGGDIAALMGICKHVVAIDEARLGAGQASVIDREFLAAHTSGFDGFLATVRAKTWADIERVSGIDHTELMAAAEIYAAAPRVIGVYGMGLTQHVHGSQSIGMLVNLLLLRGNIGRPGTGIAPVRGHSNVQGQRTVGITEKPDLVPMDRLERMFGFTGPRQEGLTTVEACAGVIDGRVKGFIGLGGNFVRAVPDKHRVEAAWPMLALTVNIATKLNRSHLNHGRASYLLPCRVRSEEDLQRSGPQTVSMEDGFSHIYASVGKRKVASE